MPLIQTQLAFKLIVEDTAGHCVQLNAFRVETRYAFPEAVLAHVISVLRHMGLSASSVAAILDRLDQNAFKQALDEFEANLVEEVILTLPISRYSEPDDECDLETVHTSIVSAHETLDEIDALYIRLTDISQGIKEGHI